MTAPARTAGVAPGVAVVVPTHHRPQLLRRTVDSILGQDYGGPIQIVIVFDGSEPDPSLVQESRRRSVRVTTNVHTRGLAGARNSGIDLVGDPWVAFCDDDDEWLPGKLRRQMEQLALGRSRFSMTGSLVNYRGADRIRTADRTSVTKRTLLHSRIFEIPSSSFVIDTAMLRNELGGIDEELPGSYGEDYDLMLRAANLTDFSVVEDALVRVHWHGSSFFFERWKLIDEALTYLVDKHPEFVAAPHGLARIRGQQAIAQAEIGQRGRAIATIGEVIRLNWREPRWALAMLVVLGLPANLILKTLHRFGRGI